MNIGTFAGRVGNDAELKYTTSGKAVASFSIAIDQGKNADGNKRNALWVKATLWEKRAESLAPYITKGKFVIVSGPVSSEAWVSKNSGNAESKVVVTVREFTFGGGDGGEKQQGTAPAAVPASDGYAAPINDDDIPF